MKRIIATLFAFAATVSAADAGRIVVNHDEWTLSNIGYANAGAANADRFAKNVAAFLADGGNDILIRSNNFGLTQANFLASLAGYNVTQNVALPLTLANLSAFDAVFVGGNYPANAAEAAALVDYVNGGGGLYIAAGTGIGGAAAEAAAWNAVLASFGLSLGTPYNGVGGVIASSYAHPIFDGVTQLFYNNGNSVSDLDPGNPLQQVFGPGYFGIVETDVDQPVPAPAALALFGLGLVGLALRRR